MTEQPPTAHPEQLLTAWRLALRFQSVEGSAYGLRAETPCCTMGRVDAGSVLFLSHGPAAGDKAPLSNQDPQAAGNAGCWMGSRVKHPPYARFHKCDLQLQTPANGRHWEGSSKLLATASDSEVVRGWNRDSSAR